MIKPQVSQQNHFRRCGYILARFCLVSLCVYWLVVAPNIAHAQMLKETVENAVTAIHRSIDAFGIERGKLQAIEISDRTSDDFVGYHESEKEIKNVIGKHDQLIKKALLAEIRASGGKTPGDHISAIGANIPSLHWKEFDSTIAMSPLKRYAELGVGGPSSITNKSKDISITCFESREHNGYLLTVFQIFYGGYTSDDGRQLLNTPCMMVMTHQGNVVDVYPQGKGAFNPSESIIHHGFDQCLGFVYPEDFPPVALMLYGPAGNGLFVKLSLFTTDMERGKEKFRREGAWEDQKVGWVVFNESTSALVFGRYGSYAFLNMQEATPSVFAEEWEEIRSQKLPVELIDEYEELVREGYAASR